MNGKHLKVVGKAGDVAKLGQLDNVKAFLASLVTALGMRSLGELSFDVPVELSKLNVEPFEDEGGITGVAVLSTSHCSIHTWPARNHFVLDVYSCRDFAGSLVTAKLIEFFGLGLTHITDLSHALRTPEQVAEQVAAGSGGIALDPTNFHRWMVDRDDYAQELADMSDKALSPDERKRRRDARNTRRAAKGAKS